MSTVRMQVGNAEALIDAYATAADTILEQVAFLSPLVTQAVQLLNLPSQNSLYGPIPALANAGNELAADGRDLSQRVDIFTTADSSVPVSMRVAQLNWRIANWNGTDNDPILDAIVRERNALITALAQHNGITSQDAELALTVLEIDRLSTQAASIPSREGAATSRAQRDELILDLVDGDIILATVVARNMNQGDDLKTASQDALAELHDQAAVYNAAVQPVPEEEDRGFFENLKHNLLDGGSVVGDIITGDYIAVSQAAAEHGPDVASTIWDATNEIASLNPNSPQGLHLIATDPQRFVSNWADFGGGTIDWTVDTGKLAGALAIAGNPALNAQFEQLTGRNIREEVGDAVTSAGLLAAQDPDAFVAGAVNWQQLEDDPIRWAGEAAPDVVIEVLTAGGATAPLATRRTGRIIRNTADATDAATGTQSSTRNFANHATTLTAPIPYNLSRLHELDRVDLNPRLAQNTVPVGSGSADAPIIGDEAFPTGEQLGNISTTSTQTAMLGEELNRHHRAMRTDEPVWGEAAEPMVRTGQPFTNPSEWVGDINGQGMQSQGRNNNCIDCTRASEVRWRGGDGTASPLVDAGAEGLSPWQPFIEGLQGGQAIRTSSTDIARRLSALGAGSSAQIVVRWKGRNSGHAFNAVNDGGAITWVDGQLGEAGGWPPAYAEHATEWHAVIVDPSGLPVRTGG